MERIGDLYNVGALKADEERENLVRAANKFDVGTAGCI